MEMLSTKEKNVGSLSLFTCIGLHVLHLHLCKISSALTAQKHCCFCVLCSVLAGKKLSSFISSTMSSDSCTSNLAMLC